MMKCPTKISQGIAGIDFDSPGKVSDGLIEVSDPAMGSTARVIDAVEAEELTKDKVIGNRSQKLGARFDDPSIIGCLIAIAAAPICRRKNRRHPPAVRGLA
jgi:hypothetical protein